MRICLGHETGSEWAAVINLVKDGDAYKVSRYHVIVVSAPLIVLGVGDCEAG